MAFILLDNNNIVITTTKITVKASKTRLTIKCTMAKPVPRPVFTVYIKCCKIQYNVYIQTTHIQKKMHTKTNDFFIEKL